MKKIKLLLILVTILGGNLVSAQSVVTPYSILGVGDLAYEGFSHNQAIGEIGVGYSTIWHINHNNPAWLYRNTFSTFQLSLEGESRRFATLADSEGNGTAGLRTLALALPIITNRLSTSFGILPYSTVNYNISSNKIIDGTEVNSSTNLRGQGGLTQAFFSSGLRIGKNFGVGVRAKYIFGTITATNGVIVNDTTILSDFQTFFEQETSYNDLNLVGGLSYRKQVADDRILSLGLTYEMASGLEGSREEIVERRTLNDFPINTDTLATEEIFFEVPAKLSVGFYYEKVNKFGFGADVSFQDWSGSGFENGIENFDNTIKIAVGGEYIPVYNDVNSYFKRATYRAGLTYEQLPYLINNTKITDFGINFGTSFPVGGLSSMDVAFKIGQRGTTENELIRETYFKFVFGATINDRWFIRREYD
ncbi:MAG: hypothetical protein WBA74_08780 [Cyclobacteriaceae bacterium]